MKRADTLLRVKRFKVDELKRRMATLDAMKADLDRKLARTIWRPPIRI